MVSGLREESAAVRVLYWDCFAGISGDMHLAALIDLGLPQDYLQNELGKLGLTGWSLRCTPDSKNGIGGTRVDVEESGSESQGRFRSAKARSVLTGGAAAVHEHRSYRDIQTLIGRSSLSAEVKALSLKIFDRIAQAEAQVHGVPVAEVGFHEVGAIDSIIDIVGAAIGIDYFKPDQILATPPELGGGMVRCAHGLIPVPAPATAAILKGIPVRTGAVPFEMTTPTGAAILAACVTRFTESERMTIHKTGYGVGHRTVAIPNLLRVHWAEIDSLGQGPEVHSWAALGDMSSAVILECNLDDMTGEALGSLFETLMDAGASDVWQQPITMKKGRPGVLLSVLCPAQDGVRFAALLLRHTSTFGLRWQGVHKLALRRHMTRFRSSLGEVSVKQAVGAGGIIKQKPEYEDCRVIAADTGRPVREVLHIIQGELDASRAADRHS